MERELRPQHIIFKDRPDPVAEIAARLPLPEHMHSGIGKCPSSGKLPQHVWIERQPGNIKASCGGDFDFYLDTTSQREFAKWVVDE